MKYDTKSLVVLIASVTAYVAVTLGAGSAALSGDASGPVTITLPPDARTFGPGPGQQLAQANCTICHAADYVYTQPPLSSDQWRAEVTKMQKAYGAPIPAPDVDALVAYLVSQNGKP